MNFKYPVYQPSLAGNEKNYVINCLDSNWISSKGKYVSEFEKAFSSYLDVQHAATVCNGTAAIHLALVALGIGPGDEVIVPTFTYIASVNAIKYTGATPVFVDSLLDSWQMDPNDVAKKITKCTKAILCVHLYGHPCSMIELSDLAEQHHLFLVEDCAEALGSKYEGRYVGTFGDIATFSFYGNKTITTGEGGMVVCNDETLFDRMVHYKGQGLAKHREYWHDVIGYNYRMTNICAAIGLAQLERINEILNKKQQIAEWYRIQLENTDYVFHLPVGNVFHSYWMCSLLVKEGRKRDQLKEYLKQRGIETRPLFYPVHTMPMYAVKFDRHPGAEYLGWHGINLPSYPDLEKDDITYIATALKEFIAKGSNSQF